MGRDKPKKFNKMNYQQQEVYVKDQLKKYGGGAVYYDNGGARGSASTGMFDLEASRNVLESKVRNDFDYRTSASHMDDIKGDASMSDFVNYQRGAQKLHKKAGNGGEYSSNEDITTVTNNLVKDHRRTLVTQDDLNGMRSDLEAATKKADEPQATYTYESSDEVANAQERLDKYKLDVGKGNIFGDVNADPPRADDQKDAASSFASDYSSGVKAGSNLKENKARNLNNAMNTAKGSYRNQFM